MTGGATHCPEPCDLLVQCISSGHWANYVDLHTIQCKWCHKYAMIGKRLDVYVANFYGGRVQAHKLSRAVHFRHITNLPMCVPLLPRSEGVHYDDQFGSLCPDCLLDVIHRLKEMQQNGTISKEDAEKFVDQQLEKAHKEGNVGLFAGNMLFQKLDDVTIVVNANNDALGIIEKSLRPRGKPDGN